MPSFSAPIILTPALEAGYAAVVDLANRAYRGTGDGASWNVEDVIEGQRITLELLHADIAAKPDGRLLLWHGEAGSLLGCVWLEPMQSSSGSSLHGNLEKAATWYLGLLAVDPCQQKQQLGRTLLAAAEEYARIHGASRIRMTVIHVRETLIAWYQRRGYSLTGETEPFPYGDNRFGRPLRDDLYFVVLEKPLTS